MDSQEKSFDFKVLKRTLRYVKPYRIWFWLTIFTSLILGFLSVSRPYLIKYAIDDCVLSNNLSGLVNTMILMIVLLIFESVFHFLFIYGASWIGQNIIEDLRKDLFKQVLSFKMQYFDQTPIGRLVTRLVSDIEAIAEIFSQGIIIMVGDIFKIIVSIALMFYINSFLASITLLVFPLLILSTIWFQRAMKLAFQQVRNHVAALNSFVQEHLVGMSVVQIFNREKEELKKFKEINKQHLNANLNSIWYFSIFLPIVEFLSALALALVIWWGGLRAAQNLDVTFGEIVAFITLINMLFRPIRQTADRFNVLQMGMVASDRVLNILDTSSFIKDDGKIALSEIKGNIEFKNVNFSYTDKEQVLQNLSFKINRGETIAIVGATGSGKTTIINLILRLYDLSSGEILIDGINYKEIKLNSLRKHMSLVQQDVFLFADSVLNNITLKSKENLQKIKNAAEEIGLNSFITKLNKDYYYNIGERGSKLSAGQRQLLTFLRAYVSNPSILILDEATSSVDSETEELIHIAIDKLTKDRTSIVIAHRLSTIQKADKILVLEKGCLVEQGNHQELLLKGGLYKKLYKVQFEGI